METLARIRRTQTEHTRTIVGFFSLIGILIGLLVIPAQNSAHISEMRQETYVLSVLLADLSEMELALQDMRVSVRGLLITQNEIFRMQYEQASDRQRVAFEALQQHVHESQHAASLQPDIDTLVGQVDTWRQSRMNVQVEYVIQGRLADAEAAFAQGAAQRSYEEIRSVIARIRTQVHVYRQTWSNEISRQNEQHLYVYAGLVSMALVVVFITGVGVVHQMRLVQALRHAETESQHLAADLAERVRGLHASNQQFEIIQKIMMRVYQLPPHLQKIRQVVAIVQQELAIPALVIMNPMDRGNEATIIETAPAHALRIAELDRLQPLHDVLFTAPDAQPVAWAEYRVDVMHVAGFHMQLSCACVLATDQSVSSYIKQQIGLMLVNVLLFHTVQIEKRRIEAMFEVIPFGLLLIDKQGTVLECNPQAYQLYRGLSIGQSIAEYLSHQAQYAIGGRRLEPAESPVMVALQHDHAYHAEIMHQQDDVRLPVRYQVMPVDDDTTTYGYVIAMEDMRQHYELDRLQSDFLRMMSHELRTPLMAILGATSLLEETASTGHQRQHELLTLVRDQGRRLQHAIDGVLDFARIEREGVRLQRQHIDMQLLIRRYIGQHEEWMRFVDMQDSPHLPLVVVDVVRIEQVLENIFENARRYAPHSRIEISLSLLAESWVKVTVRDYGVVLNNDEYQRVFERFYQAPSAGHPTGIGLGLTMCKYFVEAHSGTICMYAAPARDGSVVEFTVPLAEPPLQLQGRIQQHARILVIEDVEVIIAQIRYSLPQEDYQVVHVRTMHEAYQQLEQLFFDLIVLNQALNSRVGLDFVRDIRNWLAIPIFMVTMQHDDADMLASLRAGVDDSIVYPFNGEEFGLRVQALLRRNGLSPVLQSSLAIGNLEIVLARRQVTVGTQRIELTPIEFRLLVVLMRHVGQIVTHEQLLHAVWGGHFGQEVQYLWVHVSHLRRKLRHAGVDVVAIENVRGIGYRMLGRVRYSR